MGYIRGGGGTGSRITLLDNVQLRVIKELSGIFATFVLSVYFL